METGISKTVHLIWPNDKRLGSSVLPPLGIGYIAAYLLGKGMDVAVHDSTFTNTFCFGGKRAIYGVAVDTPLLRLAEAAFRDIKRANKDNIIVAGGPHATALPNHLMENPAIDYVVMGEAEETFHALCNAILEGKPVSGIKGIYYREGKRIVFTGPAPLIKDLDILPFPRYDLFPMVEYLGSKPVRELNMITSRGCPFDCVYCQPYLKTAFGRNIRFRSPKNVVDEMIEVRDKYRPHIIFFCDDFVNPAYARDLCNEMIKRKVNLFWRCQARACLDKDVLRLMKKAGCMNIAFGVESGSQKVLDAINKRISLDSVRTQFKACREVGMFAHAFLMVGNPTENWDDVRKTVSFINEIKPFSITVSLTTPYPGTHLFNRLMGEKKILENIDWGAMNMIRDDTFLADISEMPVADVVKGKHFIIDEFEKSNKLARASYILSYLSDGVGALKIASFMIGNPRVSVDIARLLFVIAQTGAGLKGTNPTSTYFDSRCPSP